MRGRKKMGRSPKNKKTFQGKAETKSTYSVSDGKKMVAEKITLDDPYSLLL